MSWLKTGAKMLAACLALWQLSPQVHALVILQYHHIATDTPAATSTAPKTFRQHLQLIKEQGFDVVSLEEVSQLIRNQQPLPDKSVLISFDDSYSSIYTTALPALKDYNYPFVVFANTEPVEDQQKNFMTWQQLKALTQHGGSIANHTSSHTHMVRMQKGESHKQWRQRMMREIQQAQSLIQQHTGQDHRVLAYPYGEFNPALIQIMEELDYLGMGQHSGPVAEGERYAIPRFPMGGAYGGEDDFILKLNTLPFDNAKISLKTGQKHQPFTPIITSERQPTLAISLDDKKLLGRINCYLSPKGNTHKEHISPTEVTFRATSPLPAGRSRYNCTARADSGRYHWLSVPFIARQKNGEWLPE
ncbi:MAG TPA: polysaccharide deacetylase family protein [Marinagarivorans sp.]